MRAASPSVRILTLALAAALASIVAWWTLQLASPRPRSRPASVGGDAPPWSTSAPASRLFGGSAATGRPCGRARPPWGVQVLGIAASRRGPRQRGAAGRGQPPAAVAAGDTLPGGMR
jgi:hypothetical protein